MDEVIEIEHLSKHFLLRQNSPGILGALKGLFCSHQERFDAISDLSFTVRRGERIAFIGPNGAGKSTTIKILTGILYPSSGEVRVLGRVPWKEREALGYRIGTVFGQRTQLWYHLPPSDTFNLLTKIYELDREKSQKRLSELVEIFEIGPLLHKPVRKLSLGERMRCELVASLLHNPEILFLDEPTIGLDINAKLKIRALLNTLSKDQGLTLFLTSHDTADIEQVCERVIILDHGKLLIDHSVKELKKTYMKKKLLTLVTDTPHFSLNLPGVTLVESQEFHLTCEVDLTLTSIEKVIQSTLQQTGLKDVTIEDPSMEEIIRTLYSHA